MVPDLSLIKGTRDRSNFTASINEITPQNLHRQYLHSTAMAAQEEYLDVLIVGSGSAGVTAALWLSIYNSRMTADPNQTTSPSPCSTPIKYRVLERRGGPMTIGQADGIQCRTVEIFESLDLSEDLLREAYHVLEVAFWSASPEAAADGSRGIVRTNRTADTAKGLSHMPHLILNQARVNGLLLEKARRLGGRDVDYGWTVKSVAVDERAEESGPEKYPCTVVAVRDDGEEKILKTKYVLVSFHRLPPRLREYHQDFRIEQHLLILTSGLRRRTLNRPQIPWLQHGRRHHRRRLGRHGHLPTDKLSRHPPQSHYPLLLWLYTHHPPRRRLSCPLLHRIP